MTEAEFGARNRLEILQDSLASEAGSFGRGLRDIAHVPLAQPLLADIEICLRSTDVAAVGEGLYFLQGLLIERDANELPGDFLPFVIARIEQLLDHPDHAITRQAITLFAQLREFYPRYRERMLFALTSADAEMRKRALRYYDTYARLREIEPLMPFGADAAVAQMRKDGDWCYVLRNRALGRIEEQIGVQFVRVVRTEPFLGATVSWCDWSAVRDWWAGSMFASPHRAQREG